MILGEILLTIDSFNIIKTLSATKIKVIKKSLI